MTKHCIDPPQETELGSYHELEPLEKAKAASSIAASKNWPMSISRSIYNSSEASTNKNLEVDDIDTLPESFQARRLDPTSKEDGVLFWPFKYLPLEIRGMIWVAAAEAASPQGVYQLIHRQITVNPKQGRAQLADSLSSRVGLLPPGSNLALDIDSLCQIPPDGYKVSTFTPLRSVGKFTLEIRNLYRSCSEARSELMRTRAFGSSFDFHWYSRARRTGVDLGSIRPFRYDSDWVCISDEHQPRPPRAYDIALQPGPVRCTPDVGRIENLAVPYSLCRSRLRPTDVLLKRLLWSISGLGSLKSLGVYDSTFSINEALWGDLITRDQGLFLKGVPASGSGVIAGPAPTPRWYQRAMGKLEVLVETVAGTLVDQRAGRWTPSPNSVDWAGVSFCLLLHAENQGLIDLMEFREDGSHLKGIGPIQDLGSLGRMVDLLQLNAAHLDRQS